MALKDNRILKGALTSILLTMISQRPTHGYAIITAIRRKHHCYLGPSTVYPALYILERKGLVTSKWTDPNNGDKPCKQYTITMQGRRKLASELIQLKAVVVSLERA